MTLSKVTRFPTGTNIGVWIGQASLLTMVACANLADDRDSADMAATISENRNPHVSVGPRLNLLPGEPAAAPRLDQLLPVRMGEKVIVNPLGRVRDDGRPDGKLTTTWHAIGPRRACFDLTHPTCDEEEDKDCPEQPVCRQQTSNPMTQVALGPGRYTFTLQANDGSLNNYDNFNVSIVRSNFFSDEPVSRVVSPILLADATSGQITVIPTEEEKVLGRRARTELIGRLYMDVSGIDTPDPDELIVAWRALAGPGPVRFTNPRSLQTKASYKVPGEYRLELNVSKDNWTVSDTIFVTVKPEGALKIRPEDKGNAPPRNVYAGVDRTVRLSEQGVATITIDDSEVDDDFHGGRGIALRWNRMSGPRPIEFDDRSNLHPTVRFFSPGRYEMRLAATETRGSSQQDGGGVRYTREDRIVVHVLDHSEEAPPSLVFAGRDQTVTFDRTGTAFVNLYDSFIAHRDPDRSFEGVSWRLMSGPPSVDGDSPDEVEFHSKSSTDRFIVTITAPEFTGNEYIPEGLDAPPAVYVFELSVRDGTTVITDQVRVVALQVAPPN